MSQSETTAIEQDPSNMIVTSDPGFSMVDLGIVLVVIAVAFIYLYDKLWRKRGACPECGNKNGNCTMKTDDDPGETHISPNRIQGGRKS